MNFIDHLATTCELKVRSFHAPSGIVPALIIKGTGWGKLIQKLLDNNDEVAADPIMTLRRKQFLQELRQVPFQDGYIIVYPQWFPLTGDEQESLDSYDMDEPDPED